MNEDNPGNNHDASDNNPMKRRRGRPRKLPSPNASRGENAVPRDQNFNRQENAPIPPGFLGINGNQTHQVNPNNNANDFAVGQVVHGVIEATFDDGYLIAVRVGNTENALKGLIFKPGHCSPLTEHNDVAPNVPIIRRSEVPLPAVNLNQQRGNYYRFGPPNLGASRARQVPPVPIPTAHPVPRNKVVPVVLQSASQSVPTVPNGGTVANQPSPFLNLPSSLEASKGKRVWEAAFPSNGPKPTNQVQIVGNQVLASPPTSNQRGTNQFSVTKLSDEEEKSIELPVPCENLLTEVINRLQDPLQSEETQMKNKKGENNDMDRPLSIEPLQAVLPDRNIQSGTLPKPFESFRTGKMTELLRAVQENMMENQSPQTEEPTRGSRPGSEAEQRDKGNGHPQAPRF
ncbi:hypothetical protein Ddye_027444 [Dipteronia dyeriana]|uniref:Uncharacterized protein n=1 Tax=Dipteronia dyeriana TaxID=168575 RepID=A0AAD9TQ16_9ROSI|nr:hypothetical protein Ddye_027444 [Dipteronia dyeriana]